MAPIRASDDEMGAHRVVIGQGGRLVIPVDLRNALGVQTGDIVIMEEQDGELRVRSLKKAVADAQALIRQFIPDGDRSLADELITERREAAARE